MSPGAVVVCGVAGAVAVMNAVTTRRIWTSALFERSQKVAQSVLVWLIPGSFVFVRQVLGDDRRALSRDSSDPTAHNPEGVGHEGPLHGGGHHSFDGGGAVGGD